MCLSDRRRRTRQSGVSEETEQQERKGQSVNNPWKMDPAGGPTTSSHNNNNSGTGTGTGTGTLLGSQPPELSPIEQEVLEEYERLAENMKKV